MKTISVVAAVIILAVLPGSISAQWSETGGPQGGPVLVLGGAKTVLLAGTGSGIYFTDNASEAWSPAAMPRKGLEVRSLLLEGDTLFAGSSSGVLRSDDGGVSWMALSGVSTPMLVRSLIRYRGILLAGTADGILRSSNGGMIWQPSSAGLLDHDVHVLHSAGDRVYAGTGEGVFLSNDDGQSWNARGQGLPPGAVYTIASGPTRLYAGTSSGVYIANAEASTWWPLFLGPTGTKVSALLVEGSVITVGTDEGVSVSTNGGWTWSASSDGLPDARVLALWPVGTVLLAGTADGIALSTDGGQQWTALTTLITASEITAVAGEDMHVLAAMRTGKIAISLNGAETWEIRQGPDAQGVAAELLLENGVALAGTGHGVKASTDGGRSWAQHGESLEEVNVTALARARDGLLAGTNNGVYLLAGGSSQWVPRSGGLASPSITALCTMGEVWIAGTRSSGLFRSTDAGSSWVPVGFGRVASSIHALTRSGSQSILVGTSDGIYRSSDAGEVWERFSQGIPEMAVYDLTAIGSTLLAACGDRGVYRYLTREGRWESVGDGLTGVSIMHLAATATKLVASTEGQGVMARGLLEILPPSPTITTVEPVRAPTGGLIAISGSGFLGSISRVFFGSLEARVQSADAGRIVASVPEGAPYAPVMVTCDGMSARSGLPFSMIFSSSRILGAEMFQPPSVIAAATGATLPGLADVDGDGRLDIIALDPQGGTLQVFRNTGTVSKQGDLIFSGGLELVTGQYASPPQLGDLDADGDVDLLFANAAGDSLVFYQNIRTGGVASFAPPVALAISLETSALLEVDVDGDGATDIVALHPSHTALTVLRNRNRPLPLSEGSFSQALQLPVPQVPQLIVSGDIDNDGRVDLVVAGEQGLTALFNRSSFGVPAFVASTIVGLWGRPGAVRLADLDLDGSLDLAVARDTEDVVVVLNAGLEGSFAAKETIVIPGVDASGTLAATDLDGDGHIDLIAMPAAGERLSLLHNVSGDSPPSPSPFARAVEIATPGLAPLLAVSDIDGDARPDLIIPRADGSGITMLTNVIEPAPASEFAARPETLSWEGVVVGERTSDTIIVANTGKILLKVDSITAPTEQFIVDPTDLKVVPGDSAEVVVTYAPDRPETVTGYLVFYHNDPRGRDSVALCAEAIGEPQFVLETPAIDFGSIATGQVAWDTLRVSNPGSAELSIDSVASTLPEVFADAGPVQIAPGATGRIAVRFSPLEGGLNEGELRLWHNGGESPGVATVTGWGIAPPAFEIRPDSIVITGVEPDREAVRMATILNVGGSLLRMDSIACALEGFHLEVGSLEISPGDSTAVTIRFAPSRPGVFTGQAFFYHNAPPGLSSIHLRGEVQGVASFTIGKNAIVFGPILLGQVARDSVLVSNPGTAQVLVDSVVPSGPEFSVQPTSALVAAGASRWFLVEYRPPSGGTHTGQLDFWHDASSNPVTVDLVGSALAPPVPPLLVSPSRGQPGLPSTVELVWRPCPEATAYRLELSVDRDSGQVLLSDSLGQDTTWSVEPLAYNTTYFWKVSARNVAGWGPSSESLAFRTASAVSMSASVPFPEEAPSPSSYRLLGVPGIDVLTAAQLFEGRQKIDWRMYQDNGAALDYLVEVPGAFPLSIGEGYWVLKRGVFSLVRQLTMPEVQDDGTTTIPLHPGPNIITNPFDRSVSWTEVVLANGPALAGDYPLAFESGAYEEAATLDPFKGYYIRNYQNLAQLKIPYPFLLEAPLGKAPSTPVDWAMEITFKGDVNIDHGNVLGVASGASAGRDLLDRWKPGPALDLCHLAFVRRDLDQRFPYLRVDFRPPTGEGHVWDLEIRNPRRVEGTLQVDGVEHVPAGLSVLLVDLQQTMPVDLRETPRVTLGRGADRLSLKLIVGSPEYAQEELARLVPERLALLQNYPNPFNPVTAIPFALPHPSHVRLEVVSLVGQTVATLVDGPMAAGMHTAHWDGTDERGVQVSSGVYFYRLMTGQTVVGTRKLVLLK